MEARNKIRGILSLALLLCGGSLLTASQLFPGPHRATNAVTSISCSGTCWATVDCGSSSACDSTSTTQTVTNGTNNVIKFTVSPDGHTYQYSDNFGTFTTFSNNDTITWTSGHTLSIKVQNLNCGGEQETITVKDNVTGVTIGTFIGKNAGIC